MEEAIFMVLITQLLFLFYTIWWEWNRSPLYVCFQLFRSRNAKRFRYCWPVI